MKAKQIKMGIFAVLLIAILMVGTSIVSVGAATQKTYLDTMGYSEFKTDSPTNNFTSYYGEDVHNNPCQRAVKFCIDTNETHYNDEIKATGETSYYVTYNLDKKYNEFVATLTAGEFYTQKAIDIKIYGDNNLLYGMGVTEKTKEIPINISVKNIKELKIVVHGSLVKWYGNIGDCYGNVILNNAYFTSEGATPEPTTKVPETTQKPTQAPTKPVENPTTVAPTTKNPVVTPTKNVEDTTETASSEKATSSNIKPTASKNATSKISTSDTATKDGANKGIANISNNKGNSDNSTIQTGAVSIAVVLFVILASLAIGGFVWYRRKIK